MDEENKVEETEQEEEMRKAVDDAMKKLRDESLIQGAKMICGAILQIINKHTHKHAKVTLRDYQRMTEELTKFVLVSLKKSEETTVEQSDSINEEKKVSDERTED